MFVTKVMKQSGILFVFFVIDKHEITIFWLPLRIMCSGTDIYFVIFAPRSEDRMRLGNFKQA